MSELKVGDAVKFKPAWDGQTDRMETSLDLYYTQTISAVKEDEGIVKVLGDEDWWASSYWETVEEWAKHQRKVDTTTELELTKHQVKMLQEWRKEAMRLLEQATIDIPSRNLKQEIKNFLGEN